MIKKNHCKRRQVMVQNFQPMPRFLKRRELAAELTARGFPVKPATLSTMSCRGGGPPFRHFGRHVLYEFAAALAWAESRMTQPRHSTSETDVP
jgi:hypothetical protein